MSGKMKIAPGQLENCVALDSDGRILASTWVFGPDGKRWHTDKQAVRFCSEGNEGATIKWLTADEFNELYETKGWANV